MEVSYLTKEEDFAGILQQNAESLKILYFYVDGAPECDQITDVLSELSGDDEDKFKGVLAYKIDATQFDSITKKFNITRVPSVVIYHKKEVDRIVGANVPEIMKSLTEISEKLAEPDLTSRLVTLINKAPCVLFMKGSADVPRCGFSKQVIELLRKHSAKFETFDILEDFEVREGLKKHSNWPTYPQLYVRGELIGGLDILRELSESNELDDVLKGTGST